VPVVSGLVAWGIHSEEPSLGAVIGITIIVLASWLMFAESGDWKQVLQPFRRMLDDSSARYMLIFSVLNGVFVNLMNSGGDRSSGTYFLWLVLIGEWFVLTTLLALRGISPLPPLRANLSTALMTGTFWALGMVAFFESLSFTMVAYAMAAKCTHTIFIVILGYFIFREHEFRKRLGASLLLILGLCVLLLVH
jgi:drug/metabolite transporter (DMT)-like permease